MNAKPSQNSQTRAEIASLPESPNPAKTWRYHTVTVLLFAIEVQYKLLMFPALAVVACLRFSFSSLEKLIDALTPSDETSATFVSQD